MKTGLLPMKGFPTSAAVERAMAACTLSDFIAALCMKTAAVVAGCYFVFLSYVAVTYTHSWEQKLRLLPLFLLAFIVPLLGKVVVREQ